MKTLKTILLVTLVALFTFSCSKDNDSADDATTQNRVNISSTTLTIQDTDAGNIYTETYTKQSQL